MNRRLTMAVIMVGMAVLLTGGSLMASNMGFKLNLPLYSAGEAVPETGVSIDGTNTLSLPYNKQTGLTTALTLGTDIGGFSDFGGGPVLNIQRLKRDGNTLEAYDGAPRGTNFALVDGAGYRVRVSAHVDYIVVGSHDPSLPVTLLGAGSAVPEGGVSIDGIPQHRGQRAGSRHRDRWFHGLRWRSCLEHPAAEAGRQHARGLRRRPSRHQLLADSR